MYSFIFLVNYKPAQEAGLFHNTKLEGFTSAKHSNLLGQLLSYEEIEVLWIHTQICSKLVSFLL